MEKWSMSIVRIGLGETKNFAEGYDAIFGNKEKKEAKPEEKPQADQAKPPTPKDEKK
jgi:hypothetical protein